MGVRGRYVRSTEAVLATAFLGTKQKRVEAHANAKERPVRGEVFLDRLDKATLLRLLNGLLMGDLQVVWVSKEGHD